MASQVPQTGSPPPPPNWGTQPPPPPGWHNAAASGAMEYGGFWLRVVAYLIDAIVISFASFAIGFVIGGNPFDPSAGFDPTINIVSLVIGVAYFATMESSSSQGTLGKMAVGLKVARPDGSRIGPGRAIGRYFAKFLSAIILAIGYIMVAFTDRKRGLHDMICDTVVIKR